MFDSQRHLEGRKFCVVFVQVDEAAAKVRLHCFRGRASLDGPRLQCVGEDGRVFTVPATASGNVLPSDGTALLGDAEFFVLVKADPEISFQSPDAVILDDEPMNAGAIGP